jgi:hypothetical protein
VLTQSVQRQATGWTAGVRFLTGEGEFSLLHRVHIGSGAHPASRKKVTVDTFTGGKAAGA